MRLPLLLVATHATLLTALHVCEVLSSSESHQLVCENHAKYVVLSDEPHAENDPTVANSSHVITCQQRDHYSIDCNGTEFSQKRYLRPPDARFYLYALLSIFLIGTAGLMSGMQLGLLSISANSVKIISNAGEPKDKESIRKIAPLLARRHLLLVALLLGNAGCLETLPLFLDELMSPFMNILVSVTAVLFFGEIIPQAVCSRFGLKIGSALSWLVWGMIIITFPISWPLSKLLDALLGKHEQDFFRRSELKELMMLQTSQGTGETKLTEDEALVIGGALEMTSKTVACCLTPMQEVFMLERDTIITTNIIAQVQASGRSRIPVYSEDRNCIKGMLLARDLLGVDLSGEMRVGHLAQPIPTIYSVKRLYDCLKEFQEAKIHIAAVYNVDKPNILDGIVTMEDIIEELLQEEIMDEMDITRDQSVLGTKSKTLGRLASARIRFGNPFDVASRSVALSVRTYPPSSGLSAPDVRPKIPWSVNPLTNLDTADVETAISDPMSC